MSTVISVDGLGVEFYRARRRRLSVRERLFPGRNSGAREDTFWALKDVKFDIQARARLSGWWAGNGSGKSTLLKMIAGVLLPDEGSVTVSHGVAPMIELTGGFVGELTGRDNIYLTAGLPRAAQRRRSTSGLTTSSTSPGTAGACGSGHPLPALLLRHEGPPGLRRDHHPGRADHPRG